MDSLTINFAQPEQSNIRFRIHTFNDGETHLIIEDEINHKKQYEIITRVCNATDLFVLLQCCDILNRHGVEYSIRISYFMSMRMDRVMTWNESFTLKLVGDLFNTVNKAYEVSILEPHSNRIYDLVNNLYFNDSYFFYREIEDVGYDCVVYPDKGAKNRYRASIFGVNNSAYAEKTRDVTTGAIIDYKLYGEEAIKNASSICVIDDLCDGGRTFVELAKLITEINPDAILHLYIVHAVNANGIRNVSDYYDEVITTNSFADWKFPELSNVRVENVFEDKSWQ